MSSSLGICSVIHCCWNNALHCCETKHNGFQTFPCSDPRYKYWFMAEKVRAISTFLQNQPLLQDMAGNTATTLTLSQYLAWIIYMFGLSFYRIVLCSCVREKSIRIKGCRNCRYLTLVLQRMMGADSKVMYTIYFVLLPNFHISAGTFLIWLSSLKFRAFELNTNKGFMDKYLDLQMAVIKH